MTNMVLSTDNPLDAIIYNRKIDQETATGKWFSELVQPNPWYKDVVPDVCSILKHSNTLAPN
jgi:D-amino-acid oxidase